MQRELLVSLMLELKTAGNDFDVVRRNRGLLPIATYKAQLAQQVRSVFEASGAAHLFPPVATSFPGFIPSLEPSWPVAAPFTKQDLWQSWRVEIKWVKNSGQDNMRWRLIFWGEAPVTGKTPSTRFWALSISGDPKASSLHLVHGGLLESHSLMSDVEITACLTECTSSLNSCHIYSCHQKSAYTMLHCCNWQHNPASPNAPAFQLNILLGIAQPSLSITRFKVHSKICISVKCLRPAAGAVQQSKSRGKGRDKLWQFVLHRQCNVLWKLLQVVALKAKVC